MVVNGLLSQVVHGLLAHCITQNEHESISIGGITNWNFEMLAAMQVLCSENHAFPDQPVVGHDFAGSFSHGK